MYQHFIVIARSYSDRKRVVFHMTSHIGKLDTVIIKNILDRLQDINRYDVGINSFTTYDSTWESVLELDSYFDGVVVYEEFDEFEKFLILNNMGL